MASVEAGEWRELGATGSAAATGGSRMSGRTPACGEGPSVAR